MAHIIPASEFKMGHWLNGMGVSWDIAAEPPCASASDFGWRFAIARIDADVPFSAYRNVDRVFTLIEGQGLDLDVEGLGRLAVHAPFEPHCFPGDVPTSCILRSGPCRALNLFLTRGLWRAEVETVKLDRAMRLEHEGMSLVFALQGKFDVDGEPLSCGDAAIAARSVVASPRGKDALLYVAGLFGQT